jgi:ferredoxin
VIGLLLYKAAWRLARALEDAGHQAIPMCVSGKWSIHPHKGIETDWMADFSNRHAAVAAGLGELGLHGLCITPQFGTRQRFISVITSAPLQPDPMYSGPALCDGCDACLKMCPMKAIASTVKETVDFGERQFTYYRIDHWRCGGSEQADMTREDGPKYDGTTEKAHSMPPEGVK